MTDTRCKCMCTDLHQIKLLTASTCRLAVWFCFPSEVAIAATAAQHHLQAFPVVLSVAKILASRPVLPTLCSDAEAILFSLA